MNKYPKRMEITGIKDIQTTGNFEVVLLNTNQTIHSKKNFQGHGRCETDKEKFDLCEIIDLFIKYLDNKSN